MKSRMAAVRVACVMAAIAAALAGCNVSDNSALTVDEPDIQGTWRINDPAQGGSDTWVSFVFEGRLNSGSIRGAGDPNMIGNYNVNHELVDFTIWSTLNTRFSYVYQGEFTDNDSMSGTYTMYDNGSASYSAQWRARRN